MGLLLGSQGGVLLDDYWPSSKGTNDASIPHLLTEVSTPT